MIPASPLPAPPWCVPGRLFRSWEHLSLSLSPFLDGCVLGRLSGSWEHHRLIPFLVWCVL